MSGDATARAGRFITLEGGEGVGKSTQARHLAARLEDAGIAVCVTREPGGSAFAERLRNVLLEAGSARPDPMAEALTFYAARADHLAETIRPALASGAWVICDRFHDSTRVYQGLAGGVDAATLDKLDALVVAPMFPDCTLILDLSAEDSIRRMTERRNASGDASGPADMFEAGDLAYHQALRDGFNAVAAAHSARCVTIDARPRADIVADAIWSALVQRYPDDERLAH
ncbi:MAG: dTMP kinase [Pseudomonadota bacterium]